MLTDTNFSIVPGQGLIDHDCSDGQLIGIKDAAAQ